MSRRARKIADCSSGIGVQLECPFDAIGRSAAGRSRLEAPLAKPCLCHVQGQVALQFAGVESRETVRRFDLQCHRRGGDRRSKRKYCDRRRQSAEQDSWVETYPARQIAETGPACTENSSEAKRPLGPSSRGYCRSPASTTSRRGYPNTPLRDLSQKS